MNGLRSRVRSLASRPWRAVTTAALMASSVALASPPPAGAVGGPPYQIDLKVLVLDDNASPWVAAMQSQMQIEGVPFTSIDLTGGTDFTGGTLASGSRAFYQAVVLPSYNWWGLSADERSTLQAFESKFSIREVDMYNYPGADFGLGAPVVVADFTGVTANVNDTGKAAGWGYLNGPVPFSIGSAGYLAQPVEGGKYTSVLDATVGSSGSVMGIYADSGREHLVVSATLSYELPQFKYLAHGIITWMTRGVHFGYTRNNFTMHIDDAFAVDSLWDPVANCTPGEDCTIGTPATATMSADDVTYAVTWMQAHGYQLTMAFNGSDADISPATAAFQASQGAFRWLNHGFQHLYQGCRQTDSRPWQCVKDDGQVVWITTGEILAEIDENIARGAALGLTFDPHEYLSGEHSGLKYTSTATVTVPPTQDQPIDNPNFLTAMDDRAMVAIGADASRETDTRLIGASTNTVPRHPTALYYNADDRARAIDEYNWIYTTAAAGGSGSCGTTVPPCITPLTLPTEFDTVIVSTDAAWDLGFVLSNDPRPFYAHTTNLVGGASALAYPLLEAILGSYRDVFAAATPLKNLTLTEAASQLIHQKQWVTDSAAATGYVQNGVVTIDNSTGHAVPFTAPIGSFTAAASLEPYGGEVSAWLDAGDQTVNVPTSTLTVGGGLFHPLQAGRSMSISAAGTPSPVVSVTGTVPPGLTITPTPAGADITGTPAAGTEGLYPLLVTLTSVGYPRVEQVTLVVARAPQFTSLDHAVAVSCKPFSHPITTTGGVPAPTIASSALPDGVTLTDNGNGTATLSGTPAAGTGNQQFSIMLTATSVVAGEEAYSVPQAFTLTVNTVPAFTSPATASAVVAQPFAFTVTASGIPAPSITTSGALPSGITFTDNGNGTATLTGTAAVGDMGKAFPITLTATSSSGVVQQVLTVTVTASASLTSIAPARLVDTRPGYTTVDGQFAGMGQRQIGSTLEVQVAGRGDVPVDAIAVALNVTSAEAVGAGYLTVFPCGDTQPTSSNLNYTAASVVPNAVIAKLGTDGKACVFTSNATQLIVDVNGYFPAGSTFHGMNPARFLETRAGLSTVDGQQQGDGMRGRNTITTLHVGGRDGVPAGIAAVVLNVTVTEAQGPGFVAVYPCGPIPTASNINYIAGSTVANMAVATVDSNGNVCLYNSEATHLVVDVNGYFPNDGSYQAMDPARLLETRPELTTIDGSFNGGGLLADGTVTALTVAGRGGVPANAKTVVLNVTVTEPTLAGFITVYPCGIDTPLASNLNYTAGETVAIAVIAHVPPTGKVCLFNSAATQLIADVNGYLLD